MINIINICNMRLNKNPLSIIIISLLISIGVTLLLIYLEIKRISSSDLELRFPINTFQLILFLSRPILLMTPFLLVLTIVGAYILTRLWMRDVVIQVITQEIFKNSGPLRIAKRLEGDEKLVFYKILQQGGEVYQNDLTLQLNLPRYKVTRILIRLENLKLIVRERRGMSKLVRLTFSPEEMETF
ncbi:hypothetical protein A3K78_06530 [Candidatus Bathyarchaeota archaeon RBG_13_52_12]|nr:MAG: hypothetical protein A3K78_06530 [Candidatus Bathyarchaeota archaeon RBG_13_52_12]